MKTIVFGPDLHVEVDPPHKVCVRNFTHNPYREKVRYFKTTQNAAKKLREELSEEIGMQSEVDPEEYCSFRGGSYITHNIEEALVELERESPTTQ